MELEAARGMAELSDRLDGCVEALETRLAILESRFNLLVIDTKELLTIMKDEPSLVARRPHLAREMAVIETRLSGHAPPRRPWWKRGR